MQLPNRLKTPPVIQKLQWIADPIKYMENAAQEYPDIFTADVVGFGDTVVFVSHPQAIQEMFTDDGNKFTVVGELNKIMSPLLGKSSIASLDGNLHKRRRQLLMPQFHGERMQAYGEQICNIAEKIWSQLPADKSFKAHDLTQEISLQVILQVIFGLHEGERKQKFKHLIPLLMEIFDSPFNSTFFMLSFLQKDLGNWTPWGRFLRLRQQVDELIYAEITERRKQANPDSIDILSLLMSATDEEGKLLTDKELRDELMILVFAGRETTANVMAWALYWIHKKPEIHQKLLQELNALGEFPDAMSIFRLPFLTAVCNEAMRIYPPSPFTVPRVVQEPLELLGHKLQAGTVIQASIYLTHHREDLYPDSKQFKPERFLERQFSPFEFIPFGGGSRRCIGSALATFEIKLFLATILSHYQMELFDSQPEHLQRRGFLVGPARNVKMLMKGVRSLQKPFVPVSVC
jgi:cytochrome P450 family 110